MSVKIIQDRLDSYHCRSTLEEEQAQRLQIDRAWCASQLRAKIEATDWRQARDDVRRFLKPNELPSLELWGKDFFLAQTNKLV